MCLKFIFNSRDYEELNYFLHKDLHIFIQGVVSRTPGATKDENTEFWMAELIENILNHLENKHWDKFTALDLQTDLIELNNYIPLPVYQKNLRFISSYLQEYEKINDQRRT